MAEGKWKIFDEQYNASRELLLNRMVGSLNDTHLVALREYVKENEANDTALNLRDPEAMVLPQDLMDTLKLHLEALEQGAALDCLKNIRQYVCLLTVDGVHVGHAYSTGGFAGEPLEIVECTKHGRPVPEDVMTVGPNGDYELVDLTVRISIKKKS